MNRRAEGGHHRTTVEVLRLFLERGQSQYGREAVTQQEHALQVAQLAEQAASSATLITAGLLHDIGHLLHNHAEDAPEQGFDDRHEMLGARWISQRFGPGVTEPVRLHVAAKRYLCTVEPDYSRTLSPPSLRSLELQGGNMSAAEVSAFRGEPFFESAVLVRRWDDAAKVPQLPTQSIEHFARYIDQALVDSGS